jgi:hypothetical protein
MKPSVVSLIALPDIFHRSGVFFFIFLGMHNNGTPKQTITSEYSQALMAVLSDVLAT